MDVLNATNQHIPASSFSEISAHACFIGVLGKQTGTLSTALQMVVLHA